MVQLFGGAHLTLFCSVESTFKTEDGGVTTTRVFQSVNDNRSVDIYYVKSIPIEQEGTVQGNRGFKTSTSWLKRFKSMYELDK